MNIFDIILLAVFAFFIFMKLYNILGRKDFTIDYKVVNSFNNNERKTEEEKEPEEDYSLIDDNLVDKIKYIKKYIPDFRADKFLISAKKAFEIIIKAFSDNDSTTLNNLLSPDILNSFKEIIKENHKKGLNNETTIISFNEVKILDIITDKKIVKIKVEFNSSQVNLVKDNSGKILEGDTSKIDKMKDIWTFRKSLQSKNPKWLLEATELGE